jgi:hypothetical protein
MAGIPCIQAVERTFGSVAGHAPAAWVKECGAVMPISPAAHL